jgi:Rrf2 family protein
MQITHQADYAIRAIHYLAAAGPEERVSTSQIAEAYQIPSSFLTKIIAQLSVAGIIRTSRGARGGVTLARPPEEISILEVLEAIDGPVTVNECVEDPDSCPFTESCTVHNFWQEVRDELTARLKNTTFDKLVKNGAAMAMA